MREPLESQIDRLANFIMAEVPGEPSQSEGAVDCAIRWMRSRLAASSAPMLSGEIEMRELNKRALDAAAKAIEDFCCYDTSTTLAEDCIRAYLAASPAPTRDDVLEEAVRPATPKQPATEEP